MDKAKRADFHTLVFINGVYQAAQSDPVMDGLDIAVDNQQLTLTVQSGVHCSKPLQLLQRVDAVEQSAMAIKLVVQPKASIRVWLDNLAEQAVETTIEQAIDIDVQQEAVCHWVTCQQEQGVRRSVTGSFQQAASSCFEWFYFGLDSGRSEENITLRIQGQQTQSRLRGLLLPTGKQRMTVQSSLQHDVANTHAEQVFRSIAADSGIARLQGRVLVQAGADKTYSTQSAKSILLNPGAEAHSCPQLEIYADDVVCNHGASIGELDETMLFYLQSRGIEASVAKRLLLQGFAQAVIDEVADEQLQVELSKALQAMGGEG